MRRRHERSAAADASRPATTAVPVPPLLIVLSTVTAGAVDAITFLSAHVFTANMTGNTVLLGLYAGQGDGTAALHSLVALGSYGLGVALGVMLMGRGRGAVWPSVLRAVSVEAVLLAGFAAACFAASPSSDVIMTRLLVSCAGLAMGIQSAAVLRLRLPGLTTTYITGTITALISDAVERRRTRGAIAERSGAEAERHPGLQFTVFATYLAAALVTAVLHGRWPAAVGLIPLATILGTGAIIGRTR